MWSGPGSEGKGIRRAVLSLWIFIAFAGALSTLSLVGVLRAQATQISTSLVISICGDGIVQSGEVCDDGAGNNTGSYGTSTSERHCSADCESFGPYCGDGVLQVRFSEQCDDGNNTSGDLCSATCQAETPVPPANPPPTGAPPVGSVPQVPGATQGITPSDLVTKVVLRGKAYPNSTINILLDGKKLGTALADSNADFLFTTSDITPGTETFSFSATDQKGTVSLTSSVVFDVIQSAVTTVANIFLPPTLDLSSTQVSPGGLLTISGQSVPTAKVATQIDTAASSTYTSTVDGGGNWALQFDTSSLATGNHTAKAAFQLSDQIKSGFGRSLSFTIGTGAGGGSCSASADLNTDTKVNLIDFSIFLTFWGSTGPRGDFNCDQQVNLADFSIMLFNWTG